MQAGYKKMTRNKVATQKWKGQNIDAHIIYVYKEPEDYLDS
jgi:hypothetical protein